MSFLPKYLNLEKHEELEENIEKIAHILLAGYYGYELTHKIESHSLLGFFANGLFLSKYKNLSIILLLVFYVESTRHDHTNIALTFLIMFYYLEFIN